ncbi:MAG: non-canonical purine NTP pyrophosphatase [Gammaproteobacteria bacterium]|nr:non-canonical purine NTP pyrophosphatase [Gammaproteobacteria bacterium]
MLEIFFLTSSLAKFDHIQYLLKDYDVLLRPQPDYGKAYEEPRILDREELLRKSVNDANVRLARTNRLVAQKKKLFDPTTPQAGEGIEELFRLASDNQEKIFIIEDTSVKIDALSKDTEFPGLDVKYWMMSNSFQDVDRQLIENGNDRRATVRSDLVIYLPPHYRGPDSSEYEVFTGISAGSIATEEFFVQTNPFYPWLDNKTFNKWFVPEGEDVPLSLLPIEVADTYDFRLKAVERLIEYLETRLNLKLKKRSRARTPFQVGMFDNPSLVVCGPTCAGKTVLAAHLARIYGYYHVEASDFMHLAFRRKHGDAVSIDIHKFALEALKIDPEIVSRQVISHLEGLAEVPVIITGFRSPHEMPVLVKSARDFRFIFIEADIQIRFQRSLRRSREDVVPDFQKFSSRDAIQDQMGLSLVKKLEVFHVQKNEDTLRRYFREFSRSQKLSAYGKLPHRNLSYQKFKGASLTLQSAILLALLFDMRIEHRYLTTTEIAKLVNANLRIARVFGGKEIITDKNNVSRYFNQKVSPFFEVKLGKIRRYRLSSTGVSHARHTAQTVLNALAPQLS